MLLNTLEVELTSRDGIKPYRLGINQSTLDILTLILEFKLATNWHISRFLTGDDHSKYLYTKLRRIWQAGLLESFKIFVGKRSGMRVYYMLSKAGLKLLLEHGLIEPNQIKTYPKAKTLLDWGLFRHESQIVELASSEALNQSDKLKITFKGEDSSLAFDFRSDKQIQALTPDYTALYTIGGKKHLIYTEFERTRKSHEAMLKKIQRDWNFIPAEERQKVIIRIIFQTPGMEEAFWLNIFLNKPSLLGLKIITTNITLIKEHKDFLQAIYATQDTVKLTKDPKLKATIRQRAKLFNF
jgi:hypothetical protein